MTRLLSASLAGLHTWLVPALFDLFGNGIILSVAGALHPVYCTTVTVVDKFEKTFAFFDLEVI